MKKIHFKRIMALMLSFVMIMGAAFAMTPNVAKAASEATFTVTADKKELHRGDQFTVSVSMSDNVNAYGLVYKMFYRASGMKMKKGMLGMFGGKTLEELFETAGGMSGKELPENFLGLVNRELNKIKQ